jgi:hypothetical protein
MEMEQFEQIITINECVFVEQNRETIRRSVDMLMAYMFDHTKAPPYFRLRLKDSEKTRGAKDLLLEWCRLKD